MATWTSGGEQMDDVLDGCVGAVVGGFQSAGGPTMVGWAVVGEWTAEPFVEEEEEQGPPRTPFGVRR